MKPETKPMMMKCAEIGDAPINDIRVDIRQANGVWRVVIEQRGERWELGGVHELIRYLEGLAASRERRSRGLR